MLDVSVRVSARVTVQIRFKVRVRIRVRAERATEVSPKHPMVAYVRVYFKLKFYGYILDFIFCLVYFVWYILLYSGIYHPVCFVTVPFVRYILSGMFCLNIFCPGIFCPGIF